MTPQVPSPDGGGGGGGTVDLSTLEACCADTNTAITNLTAELDQVEELLTAIGTNTDGLEACCATTNTNLSTIVGHVDGMEALLTAIGTNTDGLEGQLTTVIGHVDGLETLATATNALLTTIDGRVDGLEGLQTAANALLTTISASVDQLEGYVDGLEALLTTANSVIYAEDSAHASGNPGNFVLGVRNDAGAAQTSANGDYSPIATDSAGRVGIADLGGTITVDGTVAVGPTVVPGTGATNLGKAEDAAHASGDVGVMALGVRNDADAVRTSADGDYAPISVDDTGRLKTTGILTATPATSGGLSLYRNMDVGSTGQVIKASPGQVYNISARNRANEEIFLKFYNKATAPTAADIPVLVYAIDSNSGSKEIELSSPVGYAFSAGIAIRATNGIADADNTNTDLNGMIVNIGFK